MYSPYAQSDVFDFSQKSHRDEKRRNELELGSECAGNVSSLSDRYLKSSFSFSLEIYTSQQHKTVFPLVWM